MTDHIHSPLGSPLPTFDIPYIYLSGERSSADHWQNILVVKAGPDWRIKIGDFGQTKCDTEGTALGTETGTGRYQAPEQRF
jgi:hypothetical protein